MMIYIQNLFVKSYHPSYGFLDILLIKALRLPGLICLKTILRFCASDLHRGRQKLQNKCKNRLRFHFSKNCNPKALTNIFFFLIILKTQSLKSASEAFQASCLALVYFLLTLRAQHLQFTKHISQPCVRDSFDRQHQHTSLASTKWSSDFYIFY